ncbi:MULTISPECIES: hypothetical protein [unclassified Duganella]|uniref:hypothetical protein n=1 Tax=unclassified Duganella TaxID=2636909 RepID=UPI0011C0E4A6|nr:MULTISPECIES: hypothetical protein [unclassified Duganella]
MKSLIYFFLILFATNISAHDIVLKRVYADKAGNIHVITPDGTDRQLTHGGRTTRAELSKDGRTAAWLVENAWTAEGDLGPGASHLTVYRDGHLRYIECQPFIRDYWFWEGGKKVGIDCGGRHFAGTLILYDVRTGKKIESVFQQNRELPAWATPY